MIYIWFIDLFLHHLAALLYCSNYPKQSHFAPRVILGFVLTLAFSYLFKVSPDSPSIWLVLHFTLHFFLVVLTMKFAYDATWSQALFSTTAGRATKFIVANIINLLNVGGGFLPITDRLTLTIVNSFLFYLPVFILAYYFIVRKIRTEAYDLPGNRPLMWISATVLFLCVIVNRFVKDFGPQPAHVIVAESLYAIICGGLCLFLQYEVCCRIYVQNTAETIRALWQEDKKHLTESRATMEMINIKCHDIRHKIAASQIRLSESEKTELHNLIRIYDTFLETGNPALNIILANQGLLCEKEKIQLSFMGDASCLNKLSEEEVFSLFGNALNNAVEAVSSVDEEKRQISLIIQRRGHLVSASIVNYYSGELTFADGLPLTTAEDEPHYHGYGMRSMQLIAQRHGGDITVIAKDGIFTLHIWFVAE